MLPPERRLGRVLELIDDGKYFTLHSGRQTGKTTCAFWLVEHLNASGRCRAAWVDLQTAREQPDLDRALPIILSELDRASARDLPSLVRPTSDEVRALLTIPERAVLGYLSMLTARSDLPLVLLFDEADGLVGPTMVSFLAQLRAGYLDRSREPFPSSIALIGLRPVRDYALSTAEGRTVSWLGTTSPFNVSAEAATLGPFTRDEVAELLTQHTRVTGQRFEPAAVDRIFELGAGHPWLTNAMADQIVARDVTNRAIQITAAHVDAAKETIIRERRTHIDSLVARLREPRVQKILAPMIAGRSPAVTCSMTTSPMWSASACSPRRMNAWSSPTRSTARSFRERWYTCSSSSSLRKPPGMSAAMAASMSTSCCAPFRTSGAAMDTSPPKALATARPVRTSC